QGGKQRIQVQVNGEQSDVDSAPGSLQPRVKTVRSFSTTAMVPAGDTLIVADRSRIPALERPREAPLQNDRAVLLVAIETHLIDVSAQGASPAAEPLEPSPAASPYANPSPNPPGKTKASTLEPSPDFSKLFQGPLDDEAKLKAYLLRQVETLKQLHETDV